MINIAAKAGWTRIPTVKSVKGRNASSALSRDFALTEAITSGENCGDWKGDDVKDDEEDQKSYAREGRVM